jgi:hypothetical protein
VRYVSRLSRRTSVLLAAAILAVPGLLATTARADSNAPAPECDTGGSTFICDSFAPSATTWSVTAREDVYPFTYTPNTTSGTLDTTCRGGDLMTVSYSYVSGGVTVLSDYANFQCNAGDWP